MSEIRKYVIVGPDNGEDFGDYDLFDDAQTEAIRRGDSAVIARIYEFADSELVWAPDGADTWPPTDD